MFDQLLTFYAQFTELSKANPMVAGIIGLWLGALITWGLRRFPLMVLRGVMSQVTLTLTMTNAGPSGNAMHFAAFQKWAKTQRGGGFTKRFFVGTEDYSGNTRPDIGTGFGLHFFFYKGRLFWYTKTKLDSSGTDTEKYEIQVQGLTLKRSLVDELVDAYRYRQAGEGTMVIEWASGGWGDGYTVPKRTMDTVIINPVLRQQLVGSISSFIENESFYRDRAFPYKLCCILEGPPGTGKTSLVRALAGWLERDIYRLNLTLVNDDSMQRAIRNIGPKSILLIEDFDSTGATVTRDTPLVMDSRLTNIEFVAHDRASFTWEEADGQALNIGGTGWNVSFSTIIELGLSEADVTVICDSIEAMSGQDSGGSKKGGLTLSGFLNALDGVVPLDDVIVVMTTNTINAIDPAILRKGRVDHIFHVPKLGSDEVYDYIRVMQPEAEIPLYRNWHPIAGCDLQALYLENKWDIKAFIDSIPYTPVPVDERPKLSTWDLKTGAGETTIASDGEQWNDTHDVIAIPVQSP